MVAPLQVWGLRPILKTLKILTHARTRGTSVFPSENGPCVKNDHLLVGYYFW